MAWTDERVETLKKLWSDGLSASQIAKQLGGVTRNAVIGKVHRLGLSGRAAPSRPTRRASAPKPAAKPRQAAQAPSAPARARTAPAPQPARPAAADPAPVEAERLPSGEFATVLTLREGMCKWPIGDPSDHTFRFCGRKSGPGSAYCQAHAQLAYQPQAKRKRKPADDAGAVLDAITARRMNF
jgi:GcrA cell cycle regulator